MRITLGFVTLLGLLSLLSLIRTSRRRVEPRIATPTSVRDLSNDVASYIASYLVPFVTLNQPKIVNIIAFAIVLLTTSIIYIRSDMIGANPLLAIAGYRVYAVHGVRIASDGEELEAILVSRSMIVPGREVQLSDLATGISIAKEYRP